jgi:hypothetical protein
LKSSTNNTSKIVTVTEQARDEANRYTLKIKKYGTSTAVPIGIIGKLAEPALPPPPPPPPDPEPEPEPTPEPPPPTDLMTRLLGGPIPSAATVRAWGGMFQQYEDTIASALDSQWEQYKALPNLAEMIDYYDRAAVELVWHLRTGAQKHLDRGIAVALSYRRDFLESQAMPYTYNASTYWHMPLGLALHYLMTGDEKSRQAVGYSAEWVGALHMVNEMDRRVTMPLPATANESPAFPTFTNPVSVGTAENRWRARVLQAFVLSHAIGAPQNGPATGYGKGGMVAAVPGTWAEKAKVALEKIFAAQSADGSYRDETSGGAAKPFMDWLLNNALILYHDLVEQDPRILSAVKRNVNYNWANCWLGSSMGYYEYGYTSPVDPNWAGGRYPAPDLSLMGANSFAWVYKMTGDTSYRDRGRLLFQGGVQGAYTGSPKHLNQFAESSFRALERLK